jgi:hypothetical protein
MPGLNGVQVLSDSLAWCRFCSHAQCDSKCRNVAVLHHSEQPCIRAAHKIGTVSEGAVDDRLAGFVLLLGLRSTKQVTPALLMAHP